MAKKSGKKKGNKASGIEKNNKQTNKGPKKK